MSELKENLKKLRLKQDLSQNDVAEIIHKSSKTYSRYETGTLKPDIDTLIELADLYKVSTDMLLGRKTKADEILELIPGYNAGTMLGDTINRKRASKKRKKKDPEKGSVQ